MSEAGGGGGRGGGSGGGSGVSGKSHKAGVSALKKARSDLERLQRLLVERASASPRPLRLRDADVCLVQGAAVLPARGGASVAALEDLFSMFDGQQLDETEMLPTPGGGGAGGGSASDFSARGRHGGGGSSRKSHHHGGGGGAGSSHSGGVSSSAGGTSGSSSGGMLLGAGTVAERGTGAASLGADATDLLRGTSAASGLNNTSAARAAAAASGAGGSGLVGAGGVGHRRARSRGDGDAADLVAAGNAAGGEVLTPPVKVLATLATTVWKDAPESRVVALWILAHLVSRERNPHAAFNGQLMLTALRRTAALERQTAENNALFPSPPPPGSGGPPDGSSSSSSSSQQQQGVGLKAQDAAADDVVSAALGVVRMRRKNTGLLLVAALRFLAALTETMAPQEGAPTAREALALLKSRGVLDDLLLFMMQLPRTPQAPSWLEGKIIQDLFLEGPVGRHIETFTDEELVEVEACRIVAAFYRRDEYFELIHLKTTDGTVGELIRERSRRFTRIAPAGAAESAAPQGASGITHKLQVRTFKGPTFCAVCTKLMWGIRSQGYACTVCGIPVHKKKNCYAHLAKDCQVQAPSVESMREQNITALRTTVRLSREENTARLQAVVSGGAVGRGGGAAGGGGGAAAGGGGGGGAGAAAGAGGAHGENRVLSTLLKWAVVGRVLVHREIPESEVVAERQVYASELCKVSFGRWRGRPVAIKQFDTNGMAFSWDDFCKEIAVQRATRHPRIVRCHGACTTGEHPFIVMDFFDRGSLHNVVRSWIAAKAPHDWRLIISLLIDLAESLGFLHAHGIIHRDIKSANFLVSDHLAAHVMDFGVSRMFDNTKAQQMTLVGTPVWMAPEVISDEPYTGKADVYSFALVMWQLVSRDEPFKGLGRFQIQTVVAEKRTRPEIPKECLPELAALIKMCWAHEPAERPSFVDISNFLFQVVDPATGERFAEQWLRLSESALPDVLGYLSLLDVYHVGCVCRGWNLVVGQYLEAAGLRRLRPTRTSRDLLAAGGGGGSSSGSNPANGSDGLKSAWRREFAARHARDVKPAAAPGPPSAAAGASAGASAGAVDAADPLVRVAAAGTTAVVGGSASGSQLPDRTASGSGGGGGGSDGAMVDDELIPPPAATAGGGGSRSSPTAPIPFAFESDSDTEDDDDDDDGAATTAAAVPGGSGGMGTPAIRVPSGRDGLRAAGEVPVVGVSPGSPMKTKAEYEAELAQLRAMLAQQRERNAELERFRQQTSGGGGGGA